MNVVMVKSKPSGEFEEISIHTPDWQTSFLNLVRMQKRIKYDIHTLPVVPESIKEELRKMGYYLRRRSDTD